MKTAKSKMPQRGQSSGLTGTLRNLKVGTDDCIVLETAVEFRAFASSTTLLKREKMKFKTAGEGTTVKVWRVK